jgi:hypothetical protein
MRVLELEVIEDDLDRAKLGPVVGLANKFKAKRLGVFPTAAAPIGRQLQKEMRMINPDVTRLEHGLREVSRNANNTMLTQIVVRKRLGRAIEPGRRIEIARHETGGRKFCDLVFIKSRRKRFVSCLMGIAINVLMPFVTLELGDRKLAQRIHPSSKHRRGQRLHQSP